MADALVDVRCLQDPDHAASPTGRHALALLRQAQPAAALAGLTLVALADPALPALGVDLLSLFDRLRTTAYTGGAGQPTCFLQLSPMAHDPLFVARLLHHLAIPAAALVVDLGPGQHPATAEGQLEHHIALRWLARYDLLLPVSDTAAAGLRSVLGVQPSRIVTGDAGRLWAAIAARLRPAAAPATVRGPRPRVALLTTLPPTSDTVIAGIAAALCPELGQHVDLHVFTPTEGPQTPEGALSVQPLSALPQLSSRFDRVVGMVANTYHHAPILEQLRRYGGACIVHDTCLFELYQTQLGAGRTQALAEAELGRPLGPHEIWHWLSAELPPGALLLGELAAAAEPLIVHSRWAAAEIARRYGRAALHLPAPLAAAPLDLSGREPARTRLGLHPGQVLIASFGLQRAAQDCIWALELLGRWGVDARLHFVGPAPAHPEALHQLCAELGLLDQVAFMPEQAARDHLLAADVGLQIGRRGLGSLTHALADCVLAGLPGVASAALADAIGAPAWVRPIPDQPSPVLIAEAVMEVLAASRPSESLHQAYAAEHGYAAYARRLCQALDLA